MSAYPSAWRLAKPLLILPGTVLVLVPGSILWATGGPAAPLRWPSVVLGVGAGALGFGLAGWAMHLFATRGQGTPAPWDPPARLVVEGPYRHVRNPMITGVLLMLLAEALLLRSWALGGWLLVFAVGNAVYFPLFEEPGLRRRFGQAYLDYCAEVPRWIPRLRPWSSPADGEGAGAGTGA